MKRHVPIRPGTHGFPVWSLRGSRAHLLAFGALIFVCAQLTFAGAPDVPGHPDAKKNLAALPYRQGELIVRFADTGPEAPIRRAIPGPLTNRAVKNILSNMAVPGAAVHKEFDRIVPGLTLVKLPWHATVADGLFRFSRSPDVLYVEPNYRYKLLAIPNDPWFYRQWGMRRIDAPEAWDIHTGDPNIIVAVIDTGIDYNHPDLSANMWINPGEDKPPLGVVDANDFDGVDDDLNGYIDDICGYDFAGTDANTLNDGDGDPCDIIGHGTHISGIIGAVGDNNEGVVGICWDVSIMSLKIFADDVLVYPDELDELVDPNAFASDAVEAIQYAIDMGANVINASWGGPNSISLYNAIDAANANGILFIAAAGNNSLDNDLSPVYPASYDLDNIISVMATNPLDRRSQVPPGWSLPIWGSNYGATSVDIAAPGGEMWWPDDDWGIYSCVPGDGYDWMDGTSMAAAHVAGAAALLWSAEPTLTHIEVKERLLHPWSVDQLPALQGLCVTGGRLNLFKTLNMPPIGGRVVNTSIPYEPNDPNTYWDSIQAAIDANDANDGDVLIADAAFYHENIDFSGKSITLRSGNIYDYNDPNINPKRTIIYGQNLGSVVTFQENEGPNTVLKGFTITGGLSDYGGGIECDGASPTITDCIITGNTADYGGGIECNGASPTITDCNITYNTAMYNGGGIDCNGASPTITDCIITGNTAMSNGGGIECDGASLTITDCIITYNTAMSNGGGIDCDGASLTITDCIITYNTAMSNGGGIDCSGASPTITGCIITGNTAMYYGGGIECDGGSPTIADCNITNNSAVYLGGGIDCYYASPVITNCIITNNQASGNLGIGGGINI